VSTHIALLRAVNLAGHNKVGMADLRDLVAALGYTEGRTLLQSGNLVFRAGRRNPAVLERQLEDEARARLGLATHFFVRTAAEWATLVERNPFPEAAERDPSHLLLFCLKEAPASARVKELQAAIAGREMVRADGRHAWVVYPDGIGRSRLTSTVIEKTLGSRGTGRNWNTVLKLLALGRGEATP
jgi:uncharacterized protein (DUF1697 family)